MKTEALEIKVLREVVRRDVKPGPLPTMQQVAEALGVTKSRVHQVATILRRKGLLADSPHLYSTGRGRKAAR